MMASKPGSQYKFRRAVSRQPGLANLTTPTVRQRTHMNDDLVSRIFSAMAWNG